MDTHATAEATFFLEGGPLQGPAPGNRGGRANCSLALTDSETNHLSVHLAYQLGRTLAQQHDVEQLLSIGVAGCRELLDAEGVAVPLLDRERDELFFPYVAQEEPAVAARLEDIRFPADQGFAGHALRSGTALRCDDVSADARFFTGVDNGSGLHTRALLCAPLLGNQGALGVIEAVNPCDGGPFSAGDLALLDAIAQTLAQGIGNSLQPSHTPAMARDTDIFCKEGDYWLVAFDGHTFRLKDAKGLAHIARLLRHPDQEIHAIDLVRAIAKKGRSSHFTLRAGEHHANAFYLGDSGEMIDAHARSSYQQRLKALREELDEALALHDSGRAESTQQEIEFICQELSRAVGLGGRERRAGSPAERARVNVTRAIGVALRKIAENHPGLSQHFARTIKTGTFCRYAPDPRAAIAWILDSRQLPAAGRQSDAPWKAAPRRH